MRWRCGHDLSVSAFGSNHLQRPTSARPDRGSPPFSIRVRIESLATILERRECVHKLVFQYPRSDRITCNQESPRPTRPETSFQYPRSDRITCNASNTATVLTLTAFQYPRSDRITCNTTSTPCSLPRANLSVSAFGSNHLQPIQLNVPRAQ